jgi:hypothetical protein
MRPSPRRVAARYLRARANKAKLVQGIKKVLKDILKEARAEGYTGDPVSEHVVYDKERDIERVMGFVGGSDPEFNPDVILAFEGQDGEFGYMSDYSRRNRDKLERVAKQAGYLFEDLAPWSVGFWPDD